MLRLEKVKGSHKKKKNVRKEKKGGGYSLGVVGNASNRRRGWQHEEGRSVKLRGVQKGGKRLKQAVTGA